MQIQIENLRHRAHLLGLVASSTNPHRIGANRHLSLYEALFLLRHRSVAIRGPHGLSGFLGAPRRIPNEVQRMEV